VKKYLIDRKKRRILKYGLLRRTEALIQQFQQFRCPKSSLVLDIGTADGLILCGLAGRCGLGRCIGLDVCFNYLKAAKENVPHVVQADGRYLPFCQKSIDVVVSTATFKHVRGLDRLLEECHRVLKSGGKLVVTDPTPLGIRLGVLLRYFPRKDIAQILSLKDTQRMLTRCGFNVTYAGRFMLTPIPFSGCDSLERRLQRTRLDHLFFNQIICAERSIDGSGARHLKSGF
jgi:ubiquinone/menaquinone biosynthesis C-methylase UbiE